MEGPDQPEPAAVEVLDAERPDRSVEDPRLSSIKTVIVDRNSEAISTYVQRRLDAGRRIGAVNAPDDVRAVANTVSLQNKQFLHARPVVPGILPSPDLLAPEREGASLALLVGDHRALFAAAVSRLATVSTVNAPCWRPLWAVDAGYRRAIVGSTLAGAMQRLQSRDW